MLSEPCFLITTPVYDYLGQLQAVTGTVAVFSSVPANSARRVFFHAVLSQLTAKALFILKSTLSARTRQMIRVSLFTRATVVFRKPRRASSLFSQRPRWSSRFFTQRITDRTPWMTNVLSLRLPFFVTEHNLCFPPELYCRGTRPHQADNSLPLENCTVSTSLINAAAIHAVVVALDM